MCNLKFMLPDRKVGVFTLTTQDDLQQPCIIQSTQQVL